MRPKTFKFSAIDRDGYETAPTYKRAQSPEEAVTLYRQFMRPNSGYVAVIIRGDDGREYWVDDSDNLLRKDLS